VPKDGRAYRSRQKPYRIYSEGFQCTDERVGMGEIKPRKHQACNSAVQEKVVPLNRGSDRAGQDRPAELPPVSPVADNARFVTG
jgi:hypothetical protein